MRHHAGAFHRAAVGSGASMVRSIPGPDGDTFRMVELLSAFENEKELLAPLG